MVVANLAQSESIADHVGIWGAMVCQWAMEIGAEPPYLSPSLALALTLADSSAPLSRVKEGWVSKCILPVTAESLAPALCIFSALARTGGAPKVASNLAGFKPSWPRHPDSDWGRPCRPTVPHQSL